MIFPEAMKDEKEFEIIRKHAKTFLLANMTEFGKSKLLSKKQLINLGWQYCNLPCNNTKIGLKSRGWIKYNF